MLKKETRVLMSVWAGLSLSRSSGIGVIVMKDNSQHDQQRA